MRAYVYKNDPVDNTSDSESEFDGYNDCTASNSEFTMPEYLNPFFTRQQPQKRQRTGKYTGEVVVEILDRQGNLVPIRALLDTGTTSSILLRDFVRKGRASSYKGKPVKWQTMGGNFVTKRRCLVDFKFPELSTQKKVTWIMHVDEKTEPSKAMYDMIIGMDLMTELGIYIDTENKVIRWDGNETPLANRGALSNADTLKHVYNLSTEEPVLKEAEECQKRIMDADYSAVDITEHVDSMEALNQEQKDLLKSVLNKYKDTLFSGGLGVLDIEPGHMELIEGAVPYRANPFPIPQAYETTTKKELKRLEGIGVLKETPDSEWAAPTFIQPKKTGDVRVLTDFRWLNNAIKRKPYPLPKIADILQRLAGFTYATALDLSMGYYHVPLDEESQKLGTTVLPWAKYQWTRLELSVHRTSFNT